MGTRNSFLLFGLIYGTSAFAQTGGITGTVSDLAGKPEVYELIRDCVEKVNADLAQDALLAGSQIRRFLILHNDADDAEDSDENSAGKVFPGIFDFASYKTRRLPSSECKQHRNHRCAE